MNFIYAFLFGAIICFIGQIILENTKLTPGHLTSFLVVIGAILAFFGLYDKLIAVAHAGANIPITSFGNLLYKACYEGFLESGFLGMLTNMLSTTSGVISACIIFSFIYSVFLKPRD